MREMKEVGLFPKKNIIGLFSGFVGGGSNLEFHADLVLPYRSEFQNSPMHGQYLLVQLETPYEAILGRIVSLESDGNLASKKSEDEILLLLAVTKAIPEQLRKRGLKYRVNMQVLGVLRQSKSLHFTFIASHRRLPHLGSWVAFPSGEILREIAGHNIPGAAIGHLALGEYIYASTSHRAKQEEWMRMLEPEILIKFPIENLISRRSFIFARAGFGKSNLTKLLFSELYKHDPMVTKRSSKQVPVGTLLFDPDGEYFWPDDKGRPGLCDIPELQDRIVVFTPREAPSSFYRSFIAGGIKLDLRQMNPSDVLSIALGAHKQDQQNVQKLKNLDQKRWSVLINLIKEKGNTADLSKICSLLHLDKKQEVEARAARSNMTTVVQMLHSPDNQLLFLLREALSAGKLCILDVSQLHDAESLILSGLIMRYFFNWNQEEFTKASSKSIPIITVIEEAQSVLTEKSPAAEPHRAWVKEGRKYDLGALLITQQPGSLSAEILSQGDNWFVLHLLSVMDLRTLQKANSYFSQDILCMLLNEPIPGHAVFWSSVGGKPYPVSTRILSFEQSYSRRDPSYDQSSIQTFATTLREKAALDLEEGQSQDHEYWDDECSFDEDIEEADENE